MVLALSPHRGWPVWKYTHDLRLHIYQDLGQRGPLRVGVGTQHWPDRALKEQNIGIIYSVTESCFFLKSLEGKTGCTQGDSLSLKTSQIWPWHCLVILLAEVSASFTLLSVTLKIAMSFPPSTPNPLCTGIKCCMPNDFQHTNCTFYLYQLVVLA